MPSCFTKTQHFKKHLADNYTFCSDMLSCDWIDIQIVIFYHCQLAAAGPAELVQCCWWSNQKHNSQKWLLSSHSSHKNSLAHNCLLTNSHCTVVETSASGAFLFMPSLFNQELIYEFLGNSILEFDNGLINSKSSHGQYRMKTAWPAATMVCLVLLNDMPERHKQGIRRKATTVLEKVVDTLSLWSAVLQQHSNEHLAPKEHRRKQILVECVSSSSCFNLILKLHLCI